MNSPANNTDKSLGKLLLSLVKGSVILQAIDRFTSYLYTLLKTGFFAYLFTGYRNNLKSGILESLRNSKFCANASEFKYGMCRRIESSVLVAGVSYFMKFLLGCKLKVYGALISSFALYTSVLLLVSAALKGELSAVADNTEIIFALIMLVSSIPLFMSKMTLSEALLTSKIGKLTVKLTGFSESEVSDTRGEGGHVSTAFLIGIILGVLTYYISPIVLTLVLIAAVCAYLVLVKPELGVLAMLFAVPFLETMQLAAIVIYTTLCYLIKLFRGKRIFRLEPVDITVAAFAILMFFGGTISLSSGSLKYGLLRVSLMLAYFLVVEMLSSREWLVKGASVAVIGATLESLYAFYLQLTGGGVASKAWVDSDMFSYIKGRVEGHLENPNMLGAYMLLVLPIAVSMFIGRGEGLRRVTAFFSISVMGACLIMTWCRGAWLGIIFAALVFIFMWHHRAIWIVIATGLSLPLLGKYIPENIVDRFTSIGNVMDSSTEYRLHIWGASVDMIRDNFLTGIGLGEAAWERVYPLYAYNGVGSNKHAHNIFLQIWIELGFFGVIMFVVFFFLLFSAAFTMFAKLSDSDTVLKNPLSSEMSIRAAYREKSDKSKFQLRITAAGPLCALLAILVHGMTDYIWYNNKLYLMFWLVCGLASAYVKSGESMMLKKCSENEQSASLGMVDIPLENSAKTQSNHNPKSRSK